MFRAVFCIRMVLVCVCVCVCVCYSGCRYEELILWESERRKSFFPSHSPSFAGESSKRVFVGQTFLWGGKIHEKKRRLSLFFESGGTHIVF